MAAAERRGMAATQATRLGPEARGEHRSAAPPTQVLFWSPRCNLVRVDGASGTDRPAARGAPWPTGGIPPCFW